mgnify:CR=1 FL=1
MSFKTDCLPKTFITHFDIRYLIRIYFFFSLSLSFENGQDKFIFSFIFLGFQSRIFPMENCHSLFCLFAILIHLLLCFCFCFPIDSYGFKDCNSICRFVLKTVYLMTYHYHCLDWKIFLFFV